MSSSQVEMCLEYIVVVSKNQKSSCSVPLHSPAKRPAPGPIPISPAQKITKPAAKYGVPLTVRRPSDAIRKVPDAAKKPVKLKQVRTMGNKDTMYVIG